MTFEYDNAILLMRTDGKKLGLYIIDGGFHNMKYLIIDCHIHPAMDEETGTGWFYLSGSIQNQIDTLKRAGISQACGSPVKVNNPDSFDEIRLLNNKVLALRARFPDFYIPGIQVYPHFPD